MRSPRLSSLLAALGALVALFAFPRLTPVAQTEPVAEQIVPAEAQAAD